MEEEEVDTEDLPLTTIFHGVTSDFPVAVRLSPKRPTLQFLDYTEEFQPPGSPTPTVSVMLPAFGDQRAVASTATAHLSTTGSSSATPSPPPAAAPSTTASGSPSGSTATTAGLNTSSESTTLDEWSEDKEWFTDVQLEAKKAVNKFLECGVVSKTFR